MENIFSSIIENISKMQNNNTSFSTMLEFTKNNMIATKAILENNLELVTNNLNEISNIIKNQTGAIEPNDAQYSKVTQNMYENCVSCIKKNSEAIASSLNSTLNNKNN